MEHHHKSVELNLTNFSSPRAKTGRAYHLEGWDGPTQWTLSLRGAWEEPTLVGTFDTLSDAIAYVGRNASPGSAWGDSVRLEAPSTYGAKGECFEFVELPHYTKR